MTYYNLHFPHDQGGPGPRATVVLTVAATGVANPVTPIADLVTYNGESGANQAKHNRFSSIVDYFCQYSTPTKVSGTGTTITMEYEWPYLFLDGSLGKPPAFSRTERLNAYELAQAYIAMGSTYNNGVSTISVTVNGSAQSS